MTPAYRSLCRSTLVLTAALLVAIILVAVGVHLVAARPARTILAFGFPGVAPTPGSVVSIFVSNASFVVVAVIATLALGAARRGHERGQTTRRAVLAYTLFFDIILAAPALSTVVMVGGGVGAYGGRMIRDVVPHGPIELLGFAAAWSVYLSARKRRIERRSAAVTFGVALAVLAVAATAETYINP
jgi:hypothetical protein